MARADTRDGQCMLAVNDLFIGCRTILPARYDLRWNQDIEHSPPARIIISTLGRYRMVQIGCGTDQTDEDLFCLGSVRDHPLRWGGRPVDFCGTNRFPAG